MRLFFEGVDIAPEVSIGACWLTQYLGGHEDVLRVQFADGERRWSQWAKDTTPRALVRVSENAIDSGDLWLRQPTFRNGNAEIYAGSLPFTAHDLQSRSFDGAGLEDIVSEVARAHELSPSIQADLSGARYTFAGWRNRSDFSALSELCALEGFDLSVWSRRLIVSDRGLAIEASQKTIEVLEDQDFSVLFLDGPDRVIVRNGAFEGSAGSGALVRVIAANLPAFDQATVDRWAERVLARERACTCVGSIAFDYLVDDIAPGSIFSLDADVSGMPERLACGSVVFDFFARSTLVKFQGGGS